MVPGPPGADSPDRPTGRRREDRIVGASQATRDLIEQTTAAARSDLPVLIMGPPGGDKVNVARAIHEWGRRASRGFEHLSCVSIPEALQGREIFGCAEGVYPAVPGDYAGALDRVVVLEPAKWHAVGFDDVEQRLTIPVEDDEGEVLTVGLAFSPLSEPAIRLLEEFDFNGETSRLLASYESRGERWLSPLALFTTERRWDLFYDSLASRDNCL